MPSDSFVDNDNDTLTYSLVEKNCLKLPEGIVFDKDSLIISGTINNIHNN